MLLDISDIEARTGNSYTDPAEIARVEAAIEDVTALIESYCKRTFTDPVPAAVKAVAAREVIAALNVDPGIASERVGDLSTAYAGSGAVTALSTASMRVLRRFRSKPAYSIQLVSPWSCQAESGSSEGGAEQ